MPSASVRAALARRLTQERLSRFDGSRLAVYTAVGVNSATWARLEAGETVKEYTLARVVRALWPESEGDWTRLDLSTEDVTGDHALCWTVGWKAAMDWLVEHKGEAGALLAHEMATRLPDQSH